MRNLEKYEVRIKSDGIFFSRHLSARNPQDACRKAKTKTKRGNGNGERIIFARKVHPYEIIGSIETTCSDLITPIPIKQRNVILDNTSLTEILIPNPKSKNRKRRFGYGKLRDRARARID